MDAQYEEIRSTWIDEDLPDPYIRHKISQFDKKPLMDLCADVSPT